jgi:hypothetical protein
MDDEKRLDLAAGLLRDDTGDPQDRLAAILILLFGQSATKIAQLPATAVTIDDHGRVFLALGDTAIRLRQPLTQLAVTVTDQARRTDSVWLLPGPDGPISSELLRQRLSKMGVAKLLQARNAARASFAADIPPALIADKLGLSISAAVAWSKAVGAARSDYAGLVYQPAGRA